VKPSQPVFVGGCVATLEDCYEPENTPAPEILRKEHTINIEQLLEAGHIDFILAETQNSIIETQIICEIAKAKNIPFVISFVNKDENLLNGEFLEDAIRQFQELGALSILLNCRPPEEITKGLSVFQEICPVSYGAYANGKGEAHDDCGWTFKTKGSPQNLYIQEVKKWINLGVTVIGGCCGTTPQYFEELQNINFKN
jgi:S-methylmethionine-dependent homocysteine/selenocysteine methylase